MKSLLSPAEASRQIMAEMGQLPVVEQILEKCRGRILRQAVVADRPLPPFDRSMMDGFACRSGDLETDPELRITGRIPAGREAPELGPKPNQCAEIMTGAVVPSDADCVVPYESTERMDEGRIRVLNPGRVSPGDFIHRRGSDLERGGVLVGESRVIGSREIAVAAGSGYSTLTVTKNPSIAIHCTGDELVEVVSDPSPFQIRRSNDLMVQAALWRAGIESEVFDSLPDDLASVTDRLDRGIRCNDFLILSGGVSMGKKDYVPEALDRLGLRNPFHGVAQKPGKPFGFWCNSRCKVFALPGNPISTLVCLHQFVIPAIRKALGDRSRDCPREVDLEERVAARDDLTVYLPVRLAEGNQVIPRPVQNSGDLSRILESDGYIVLERTPERSYPEGTVFHFHPWF